jgi:hypothetical protein
MNKNIKVMLIFLVILAVLTATGCANQSSEGSAENVKSSGIAGQMMPSRQVAYDTVSEEPMLESYGEYDESAVPAKDPGTETKIIRTAYLSIEVEDYFLASQKAEEYAKKYGGYVSNSDVSLDSNDKHSGTVTIRVPELHFDAAITEITALGEIKSKNVNGNDVTEEYIDLQSRINNSKAHETRLIELYSKATNVKEMMQVENELARVRGEIESMEGRLRYMNDRVQMSTITVNLYEEQPAVKEWGLWDSIKTSFNNFLASLRWVIELIGWLLPLAIAGVLIWLGVRWGIRKVKKRQK